MCIICTDPMFSKLTQLERLTAYQELLMTEFGGDVSDSTKGMHILDKLLELKLELDRTI